MAKSRRPQNQQGAANSLGQQSKAELAAAERQAGARKGTLVEFFARSPLRGSGLKIERIRGDVRKVEFD
jgi:hypothetical protein